LAFFVLIPLYWLASILIYAASKHQKIKPATNKRTIKKGIISKYSAWFSFLVINVVSFSWLLMNQWSAVVVFISLLLMNMLLVPCSVMLLAHNPQWLKPSSLVLIAVCGFAQWMIEGQTYVA